MVKKMRAAVVFGVAAMVLGGCAKSDVGNVEQESSSQQEVQSSSISESSQATEKDTQEVVKESTDGTTETVTESESTQAEEKVYLSEYDADYDYDGVADRVYYKQIDYECYYYIDMSSAGELYLGSNAGHSVNNIKLVMCDIDGDGTDELTFSAFTEGADYVGKQTLYVYDYQDGHYQEYKFARQDDGREFTILRDMTRAQITCDEAGFDYTFWDTILDMDEGFYFAQGTQKQSLTPYWADIEEVDGSFAVRYVYSVGTRNSCIDVEELVTYTDGTEKTLAMTADDSDITKQMRSVCESLGTTDVQYEYDMDEENKLLYDAHTLIKESGIDFSYHLKVYAPYNADGLSMDVVSCRTEDAAAVYELVQDVKEKCGLRKFVVDRFTEVYGKLARAKRGDFGTDKEVPEWILGVKEQFDDEEHGKTLYYTYNEDYDTFSVIYDCGDVVAYCVDEGGYMQTLVFDGKPEFGYGGWVVGRGDVLQMVTRDVNGDGIDELVVTVTDVEENTLIVVFSLSGNQVISPCTSKVESYVGKYDGESKKIVLFDYNIGKQIHEVVNKAYKDAKISKTMHIPSENAGSVKMADNAKYKFELMADNRLKLIYTLDDLECEVYFVVEEDKSVVDDIQVNLIK